VNLVKQKNDRFSISAYVWLVLVCAIWGGNAVSIKFSSQDIPPLMAATIRSIISGILVWGIALWKGRSVLFPSGKNHHAVIIGMLFGLEFLFIYWGISFTSASRSTIFLYSQPLWVIVGAHFALKQDRLSVAKILGASLSFVGLILVFRTHSEILPESHRIGDVMQILAAVFWAASTLYIKRISQSMPLDQYQTLFAQLMFAIPVLAIGALFFEQNQPVVLSSTALAALGYQIVVVASFSYLFWFWMIHNFCVSKLASFLFLTPIFGVIFGAVILNDPVGLNAVVGLTMVCIGIFFINACKRQ
jgi:drug/metabolite transporter (DMT)-like permease